MLEIGTILEGKYRILSEIGRGGMSVVYLAINDKVNVTWAVKEIRDDGSNSYDVIVDGMKREIETLKNVKHPKIPKIIEIIEKDDSFIIVMDYVKGSSLDKILTEKGPQKEENVVKWIMQVCDVLQYLHTRPQIVIHRDMKPANIMLNPENDSIMVIDFGTAKQCNIIDNNGGNTTCLGTKGYAAPEQYGGLGRTDPKTDIFAIGMTMYALLTGIDPQKSLVVDNSIRKVNPALSQGLEEIILKCTQTDPKRRYGSCAELMYSLQHYKDNDKRARKRKKLKFGVFAATFCLSVACAFSGFILNVQAKSQASDEYAEILKDASMTTDYDEKIKLYESAINIKDKGGEGQAYLELIQAYKSNDGDSPVFSKAEAEQLQKLILANRAALEENEETYIEICYETGKLFWYYYYDNNQGTRAKYALDWFQIVTSRTDENYENYGLAVVYQNVGVFYRDITANLNEANDNGMYLQLFQNMTNLVEQVAEDDSENEIVRLELLEMSRSAIHQHASRFKRDGIEKKELMDFCNKIERIVKSINVPEDKTDRAHIKKLVIERQLSKAKYAVEAAYSTEEDLK